MTIILEALTCVSKSPLYDEQVPSWLITHIVPFLRSLRTEPLASLTTAFILYAGSTSAGILRMRYYEGCRTLLEHFRPQAVLV